MDENKHEHLENLRKDYALASLDMSDVFENPIRQFQKWFKDAQEAGIEEPNIMTLASATREGMPSARVVLLKGLDEDGFRFYTNYDSEKGEVLKENPNVSIVFLWQKLQRQVRIKGVAYRLSEEESTKYFQSRPKDSQIGAWASPQSKVIENRASLQSNVNKLEEQYSNKEVLPKPPNWGGYIIKPYKIEFWQGRSNRLHDRLRYTMTELNPKKWTINRLAP
jgi:pyridoxamine 5'-phosphate oxidase